MSLNPVGLTSARSLRIDSRSTESKRRTSCFPISATECSRWPSRREAMNPGATERYRELQDYVGWTDEDALRVVSVATLVGPFLPALIVDFYDEIARHPEAQ